MVRATYIPDEGFTPEVAKRASPAAEGLCKWVHAMSSYDKVGCAYRKSKARLVLQWLSACRRTHASTHAHTCRSPDKQPLLAQVAKVVAPKRAKLAEAEGTYEGVMSGLREKQKELQVGAAGTVHWGVRLTLYVGVCTALACPPRAAASCRLASALVFGLCHSCSQASHSSSPPWLQALLDRLAGMEADLKANTEKKERLEAEIEQCSIKLERAVRGAGCNVWGATCGGLLIITENMEFALVSKAKAALSLTQPHQAALIGGLGGERTRWQEVAASLARAQV